MVKRRSSSSRRKSSQHYSNSRKKSRVCSCSNVFFFTTTALHRIDTLYAYSFGLCLLAHSTLRGKSLSWMLRKPSNFGEIVFAERQTESEKIS